MIQCGRILTRVWLLETRGRLPLSSDTLAKREAQSILESTLDPSNTTHLFASSDPETLWKAG